MGVVLKVLGNTLPEKGILTKQGTDIKAIWGPVFKF